MPQKANLKSPSYKCLFAIITLFAILTFLKEFHFIKKFNNIFISTLKYKNHQINIDDNNFYCESQGDWLSFRNQTYFKKSASYYFVDLNIIYLNLLQPIEIRNKTQKYKFYLKVNLKLNKKSETIEKRIVTYDIFNMSQFIVPFDHSSIIIDFNLTNTLITEFNQVNIQRIDLQKSVKMNLQAFDVEFGEFLQFPLELKIKYSPHHTKKQINNNTLSNSSSVLICSKVIVIHKEQQFTDFQVWVHLNRYLGYEKIVAFNLAGFVLDQRRRDFFDKNEKMIELRQLTCFPNLINSTNETKYFRSLNGSSVFEGYLFRTIDTVNDILINECFLNNFDKYR